MRCPHREVKTWLFLPFGWHSSWNWGVSVNFHPWIKRNISSNIWLWTSTNISYLPIHWKIWFHTTLKVNELLELWPQTRTWNAPMGPARLKVLDGDTTQHTSSQYLIAAMGYINWLINYISPKEHGSHNKRGPTYSHEHYLDYIRCSRNSMSHKYVNRFVVLWLHL